MIRVLTPKKMIVENGFKMSLSPLVGGQRHPVFQRGIVEQRSFDDSSLHCSINSQVCQQYLYYLALVRKPSTAPMLLTGV